MNKLVKIIGAALSLLFLVLSACGSSQPPNLALLPNVSEVSAQANPNNVLSALLKANVTGATKVRVTYTPETGPSGTTPDFSISSGPIAVPVLGLMPETNYTLQLRAMGESGTAVNGDSVSFRTGALPSSLPAFTVTEQSDADDLGFTMIGLLEGIPSGSGPSSGEGTSPFPGPLIVDHTGRIVWYRPGFDGFVLDWQKQPNGTFTAGSSLYLDEIGEVDTRFFQLDDLGNIIGSYAALGPWPTDAHELRLLPNGDALLMSLNSREMDLTPWGGGPSVNVSGNILERISPSGQLLFAWDALDWLDIGSADPLILEQLPGADEFDFTHGNAIDLTSDGSYLISFRHLSQLIKVDQHGSIVWRLGGVDGDFEFVNDPLGGFSLQHAARELSTGNILLFDNGNGHQPPQSRAVEYRLDVSARTATLVWQYNPDPRVFGPFMGFTQRLPNGNTVITYGGVPLIQEVTAAGQVVWELRGAAGEGFYRGVRISSLYSN